MELDRRDRAGQVKRAANGALEDPDSRRLQGHINQLKRLLQHDEEETSSLVARESAFLRQAVDNYGRCALLSTWLFMACCSATEVDKQSSATCCSSSASGSLDHMSTRLLLKPWTDYNLSHRCLVADSAHDLEVVFRLVQLWLSLGADGSVVQQLRAAFKGAPSHKFLPLMYQMASRLSAATTGPLITSGFQASFVLDKFRQL